MIGWWWSLWVFRRYIRKYFQINPPDFEADLEMAREVGDLFGIDSHGDDTVHSYLERLRSTVLIPKRVDKPPTPPDEPEDVEVEGRLV